MIRTITNAVYASGYHIFHTFVSLKIGQNVCMCVEELAFWLNTVLNCHQGNIPDHTPDSPQSLPTEHARQAFSSCDTDHDGSIRAEEYVKLMKTIRGFRLSPHVKDHLLSVSV